MCPLNIMWFPCSQDSRFLWELVKRFKESVVDARTFKIGAINQRFSNYHPWTCCFLFFSMFLLPMCLHLLFVSNLGLLIFVEVIFFKMNPWLLQIINVHIHHLGVYLTVSVFVLGIRRNSWSVCDAQGGDWILMLPLWWRLLRESSIGVGSFAIFFVRKRHEKDGSQMLSGM